MRFSTSKSAARRTLHSHSYTQYLSQAAILVAALSLIALTWVGALQATSSERKTARARVEVSASNQALAFEEELNEQFLGLEQRLRVLEREWERNPGRLDLATWHQRALLLSDASLTFFIADAHGRIRSSTRPEQLDLNIRERAYFRHEAALPEDDGRTFIGPPMRGLGHRALENAPGSPARHLMGFSPGSSPYRRSRLPRPNARPRGRASR